MTEPGLFELEAVVVRQPKRSRWRRYAGPALAVSTVKGTPLAWVTYSDDTYSLLTKTSGEFIVGIEQLGPVEFRFTDAADREVGTAGASGLIKTRQLGLQTEQGRQLLLTRPGLLFAEWHLTETDPEGGPAPEILGRVTVSTIDSWMGLQQYVVEMDPRLDASERRTVVASVVCLHLLRRPPGAHIAPA
ncbi:MULTISPECIES: hypothetical protein [unclassified Streptomyces]|uniref:hypothetical protein n=1 Tax=unclassified Streptomyces TaxID=2593676 RepID=UPI0011CD3EFD|nr:hypothetical protein [Streptomyces sp. me109]TXS59477.1 hypothetical protein EAO69_41835 [Streptomyces sp. me109]